MSDTHTVIHLDHDCNVCPFILPRCPPTLSSVVAGNIHLAHTSEAVPTSFLFREGTVHHYFCCTYDLSLPIASSYSKGLSRSRSCKRACQMARSEGVGNVHQVSLRI